MATGDLRRIVPYVRPFAFEMGLMFFGATGAQVVAAMIPLVIKHVVDEGIANGNSDVFAPFIALLVVLGVAEGVLLGLRRWVLARAASMMEMNLRQDLYAHLQRLSIQAHGTWQTGQLLSRAIGDANLIFREFVSFSAVFLVSNIVTFIVVGVLLFRLSPLLALVTAVAMIPIGIMSRRFRSAYRGASRLAQDRQGDLGTSVEEAALGNRVITAFGRQREMYDKFSDQADVARRAAVDASRLVARFSALLALMPNLMLGGVLLLGAWELSRGSITLGGLVAYFALLMMLTWPVESLGEILTINHEASASAQRIFEVFDTEPGIVEKPHARRLDVVEGRVSFERVTFGFGDRDPVLRELDLVIEPGETLAIAGRTGSGKTALCALVSRLADPISGRVYIDGQDVRDVTLTSLRQNVGMAFEDPLLFSASVRENITLGHPDATDDEIAEALRLAQAQFVHELPFGLDTRIGEQGISLSGGQRQRLALARAVIGSPPVIVLDDPLSALDIHTEALVEQALSQVLKQATVLISVHRPTTAALADRVAFLDDGKIVALGTHQELLASNLAYRELLGAGPRADDIDEMAR